MSQDFISKISTEMDVNEQQVMTVLLLLREGGTVPFIARYRKEVTGSLDEVAIAKIRDRMEELQELDQRREAIIKSLQALEKLTPELEKSLQQAETLARIEDIYLPYRPKRKTRAVIAREKGLEPLARLLLLQDDRDPDDLAGSFVNLEKQVASTAEALAGARDIIAEMVNEDLNVRSKLREIFSRHAKISSRVFKGKEAEGQKFKDYFECEEPLANIPSHRLLAILRGRNEGFLMVKLIGVEESALAFIGSQYLKNSTSAAGQVGMAIDDGFKRLLQLSLEVETIIQAKKNADEQAISVFAKNLRELFMAPPLGQKRVLAIDPGFRTGCKVVCLDAQGKFLFNHTIYPQPPRRESEKAAKEIKMLCQKYEIEAIAVGNGTAGRETEEFIRELQLGVPVIMVNESGASIYSASETAREEFPDQDVTVRGAVSIGRRLMDPLAELVKIDPKSIGVGQYQHDVNQKALKQSLDDMVMSCVNAVGVEVNTASKQVLAYISGLGPKLAQAVVDYRNANGPFASREDLKKVPKLGSKAFEQAAGFLRIRDAANPLDSGAVHPERYALVEAMARDLGCQVVDLTRNKNLREKIDVRKYAGETVGLPTLQDILQELDKPGRDPREKFEVFSFAAGVNSMADLRPDMELPGIVTNVTNFGAFVDVGVHQDGLVHVSELSDNYVRDPKDFIKVQQRVKVRVLEVDRDRKRIALSMRSPQAVSAGAARGLARDQAASLPDWRKKMLEFKQRE